MKDDKNIATKRVLTEMVNAKALYKEEGLRRMKIRKAKRKKKRAENKKYNYNSATWYEDGQCMQHCEMGGSCQFPCNGDC